MPEQEEEEEEEEEDALRGGADRGVGADRAVTRRRGRGLVRPAERALKLQHVDRRRSLREQNTAVVPFWSAFPMFVPSLSW